MNSFRCCFLLIAILLQYGCTLEKRIHRSGYHISWNEAAHASNNPKSETRTKDIYVGSALKHNTAGKASNSKKCEAPTPMAHSISNTMHNSWPALLRKNKVHNNDSDSLNACDILTLNNGQDIEVKVIEVGTTIIKYKRCDNLEGPMVSINKAEVFSIKYPNGQKDVFTEYTDIQSKPKKSNDPALVSLILGILALMLIYLAPVLGLLAIIFGILALKQIGQSIDPQKAKKRAFIGIICGTIALLFVGLYVFVLIFL